MYTLIAVGAVIGVWALWNENAPSGNDKDHKDSSSAEEMNKNKKINNGTRGRFLVPPNYTLK